MIEGHGLGPLAFPSEVLSTNHGGPIRLNRTNHGGPIRLNPNKREIEKRKS